MTSPTVIVPDRSKPKSDTSNLDMPTTPYRVEKNVDADDPVEWSREPSAKSVPPINKNPRRHVAKVRPKVMEKAGEHLKRRRLQFPQLFNNMRYAKETILQQVRNFPEDREYRVWIDEVIAAGSNEDHRKKFVVTKHPGFPAYDALFELVRATPERGLAGMRTESAGHYRLVSIAMTKATPGYLPEALKAFDDRWEDMRGRMGDPRRFTRRDFEIIKAGGDSESVTPAELDPLIGKFQVANQGNTEARTSTEWTNVIRKLKWIALCKRHEAREAAEYDEKNRIEDDYVADMLDYMFDWLVQAANYGKRHKVYMFQPGPDPRYVEVRRSSGYVEKIRKGSRRHAEYLKEVLLAAGINPDAPLALREYAQSKARSLMPGLVLDPAKLGDEVFVPPSETPETLAARALRMPVFDIDPAKLAAEMKRPPPPVPKEDDAEGLRTLEELMAEEKAR